jgi:hypothetical protein
LTANELISEVVRDIDLRIRFARMPEHVFNLAWNLVDTADELTPPLLGLHNLLDAVRFTFDGSLEPAACMGHMRFETY